LYVKAGQEVTACREHGAAMLLPAPTRCCECARGDERPANGLAALQTTSLSREGKQEENSSKMKQRRGNVYENKEPLWKTC
jgi:hypothetical protein